MRRDRGWIVKKSEKYSLQSDTYPQIVVLGTSIHFSRVVCQASNRASDLTNCNGASGVENCGLIENHRVFWTEAGFASYCMVVPRSSFFLDIISST
jgi:hypothetical protein